MKIYDISQEVFSCVVYPGDTAPSRKEVCRIGRGDLYNLTDFSMCAHNGTHIDAPSHFIAEGKNVEQIDIARLIGACYLTEYNGRMSAYDARHILNEAESFGVEAALRILIKGDVIVSAEAARVFADYGIYLIGIEGQSVGEPTGPMEVHKILLGREVVLLEGARLSDIEEGTYLLNAAPICLGGAEGAPCRAILIEL